MSETSTISRPEGVTVTYRRMKFDFEDQSFERYWYDGSAFKSLFWAQVSAGFEYGETFFIEAARSLRHKVTDPKLLSEISDFAKQEGQHTAQHIKFNRINESMGLKLEPCGRRYERIVIRARKLSPMKMLAAACAMEHLTAGFADLFFRHPEITKGADPKVMALWTWHAAEEAEHRATCFDIFKQLKGGYFTRVFTALSAWMLVTVATLTNTAVLLRNDRKLFTLDTLRGLRYLFGFRGLLTNLLPAFLSYLNPRFHPWKGRDGKDIERWIAQSSRYIQNAPAPAVPSVVAQPVVAQPVAS